MQSRLSPTTALAAMVAVLAITACGGIRTRSQANVGANANANAADTITTAMSEPVEPTDTRYAFEFACPHPRTLRIEGTTRWQDRGYQSRITRVSVNDVAVSASALASINQRFPADAFQERPWPTCLEGATRIELRTIDRADGSVSKDVKVVFTVDDAGNVSF